MKKSITFLADNNYLNPKLRFPRPSLKTPGRGGIIGPAVTLAGCNIQMPIKIAGNGFFNPARKPADDLPRISFSIVDLNLIIEFNETFFRRSFAIPTKDKD